MDSTQSTRTNKFLKLLFISTLVLALLSSLVPSLSHAETAPYTQDGYRFGMNENLDKRVNDSYRISKLPFREIWAYDLKRYDDNNNPIPGSGEVQSQPIIINDTEIGLQSIFLQPGKDFLRIDYNGTSIVDDYRIYDISASENSSASAPTYLRTPSFGTNAVRIYQATRDHRFMSIDPISMLQKWVVTLAAGSHPELRYRITASPFAKIINGKVLLSTGTASGDLTGHTNEYYADNGFFAYEDAGAQAERLNKTRAEGEVTGSPLEHSGSIYTTENTGNNNSFLLKYDIAGNQMGLLDSVQPFQAGVPTSIAHDAADKMDYVVDRQGRLYKVDPATMNIRRMNSSIVGDSLVLEDPTISDDYIYVPVKYYHNFSRGGNGAVVVFSKEDLNVVNVIQLDSTLQNQVLFWTDADPVDSGRTPNRYLIVFESNGHIRFYDENNNWAPVDWFQDENGALHKYPTIPNTGGQYTSPQLVMHDGLLLVVDGEGVLHAYSSQRPHNLSLKAELLDKDIDTVGVGDTVTVKATVTNSSDEDFTHVPVTFTLNHRLIETKYIDLPKRTPKKAGDNVLTFTTTVPDRFPLLSVEVNPDRSTPSDEVTYTDNSASIYSIINMKVTNITFNKDYISSSDPKVMVNVTVEADHLSSSDTPISNFDTILRLQAKGISKDWPVTLKMNQAQTFTFPLDFSSASIDFENTAKIGVTAKVNPDFTIFEATQSDPPQYKDLRKDNTMIKNLSVLRKDDLAIDSITADSPAKVSSKVNVSAKVRSNSEKPISNALIRFTANGSTAYEIRTDLQPGETKNIGFVWTAPSSPTIVNMIAIADPNNELPDSDRSNNVKSTSVNVYSSGNNTNDPGNVQPCNNWNVTYPVITGYPTKTGYTYWYDEDGEMHEESYSYTDYTDPIWSYPSVQYRECVDGTLNVNTKQGIPTDPRNPKDSDSESRGSWAIIPYAQQNGKDPNKITRAGYGFEIKANTTYTTDWETKVPSGYADTAHAIGGSFTGVKNVTAYIYDSRGDYVGSYSLEKSGGNGINDTWELPRQEHTLLDGTKVSDRKFYTDIKSPDGSYKVIIIGDNGGNTGVSFTKTEYVEIFGSSYDDTQNVRGR